MKKQKSSTFLSCLLVVAMLMTMLCIAPYTASAADEEEQPVFTSGDFSYTISEDGTATIVSYSGTNDTLIIPSELDGIAVTTVGDGAFDGFSPFPEYPDYFPIMNNGGAVDLIISEGITTIGSRAFRYCKQLETVSLPSTLTKLGDGCFSYCDKLNNVVIPDSITELPASCFEQCNLLSAIELPDTMTSFGSSSFSCCGFTQFNFPRDLETIGNNAFSHCISLESVELPEKLKSLGMGVFFNCTALTSVTLPESLTEVGRSAFSTCTSLMEVTIPSTLTSIGIMAFGYWYNFEDWQYYKQDGFVIKGYDGSAAQLYSQDNGIDYVSLGEAEIFKVDLAVEQKEGFIELTSTGKYGIGSYTFSYIANGESIPGNESSVEWIPSADGEYIVVCSAVDGAGTEAYANVTVTIKDGVIVENAPIENNIIYFDNSKMQFSNPYIYYWTDGESGPISWPGVKMTKVKDNIYSYEVPVEYNRCIFNDSGNAQTENLGIRGNKYMYDGSWSNTPVFVSDDPTDPTEPTTTEPTTTVPETTAPSTEPTTQPEPEYTLGDVNNDGKITVEDATLTLKSAVNLVTLTSTQVKAADVNNDGIVNVKDTTLIQKYIAEIITQF